jgi:hypothetical protein
MLAWSETRLLLTLAVAALLVMEPVSWITAPIPGGCLVHPEDYAAHYDGHNYCPTFHVFLMGQAVRVFAHFADPNWVIADFTVVLAFSTLSLWVVTWQASLRQSRDMEASITVAKQSADAALRVAENAERALHSLEIPRVFPVNMSFDVEEDAFHAPQRTGISISLKNFGRSPAFLRVAYIDVAVTEAGNPNRIVYRTGRIPFMTDDVIGDKEIFGPLDANIPELVPYAYRIGAGDLRLNLLVHSEIDDALENSFGRSQWYVWNPRRNKFVPGRQLWTEN